MMDAMAKMMRQFKEEKKIEIPVGWAGRNTGAAIALLVLAAVIAVWLLN